MVHFYINFIDFLIIFKKRQLFLKADPIFLQFFHHLVTHEGG